MKTIGKFAADDNVLSGNLHHGYMRYKKFLEYYNGRENEFLELPAMPAQVEKHALEIAHPAFYSSIQKELTKSTSYTTTNLWTSGPLIICDFF